MLRKNVIGGYILSCIGDNRNHSCMFSKYKNTISDTSLEEAYKKNRIKFKSYSFLLRGSDERQFCSPGVELPLASIFRTKYGEFPEYHNSLDNFNLVTIKGLEGGYKIAKQAILNIDNKILPVSKYLCEPQLGKRGLYKLLSQKNIVDNQDCWKILDFLQFADGKNDLSKIGKYTKLDNTKINKLHNFLLEKKLIH